MIVYRKWCRWKNLPYLPAAAQPIGFEVVKGWKMQVASTRIWRYLPGFGTQKKVSKVVWLWRPQVKKAATYSPTLHCSTIGASGLNFSVRNGKRWDPAAITTWYKFYGASPCQVDYPHTKTGKLTTKRSIHIGKNGKDLDSILEILDVLDFLDVIEISPKKDFGQLVQLGFDVAVFTPAAYQRRSLRRP